MLLRKINRCSMEIGFGLFIITLCLSTIAATILSLQEPLLVHTHTKAFDPFLGLDASAFEQIINDRSTHHE